MLTFLYNASSSGGSGSLDPADFMPKEGVKGVLKVPSAGEVIGNDHLGHIVAPQDKFAAATWGLDSGANPGVVWLAAPISHPLTINSSSPLYDIKGNRLGGSYTVPKASQVMLVRNEHRWIVYAEASEDNLYVEIPRKPASDMPHTYPWNQVSVMGVTPDDGYGGWGTVYTYAFTDAGVNQSIRQVFVPSANTSGLKVKTRYGFKTSVMGDTWSEWDEGAAAPAVQGLASNADKYGLANPAPGQRVTITGENGRSEQFRGDVSGDATSFRLVTDLVDVVGNPLAGVYHWVPTIATGPDRYGAWIRETAQGQYLVYRETDSFWMFAEQTAAGWKSRTASSGAAVPWELDEDFTDGNMVNPLQTVPATAFTRAPEATENNWLALEPLAEFFKDSYTIEKTSAGTLAHEVSELSCQLVAGAVYEVDIVVVIPERQANSTSVCYITPDWLPFGGQATGNNVVYTSSYVSALNREQGSTAQHARAFMAVSVYNIPSSSTEYLRHIRGRFLAPHGAEFRPVIVAADRGNNSTGTITVDIHGSIRRVTS